MKYRHIIWDWNGTLLDDAHVGAEIFNEMMAEYGKAPITFEDYTMHLRFPVADFYVQHGFDFSKTSFEEISEYYIGAYNRRRFECGLHDGALDTIRALRENGSTQSVLSAYKKPFLLETISHYGIEEYFDSIDGLDNIYAHSKEELGKRHVLSIKIPKDEIIMIGDTEHDKHTADAMGVKSALISKGHNHPERLKKLGVPVFESHDELRDFLME